MIESDSLRVTLPTRIHGTFPVGDSKGIFVRLVCFTSYSNSRYSKAISTFTTKGLSCFRLQADGIPYRVIKLGALFLLFRNILT